MNLHDNRSKPRRNRVRSGRRALGLLQLVGLVAATAIPVAQTKGQSAFTMTHTGLFSDLDYPDVASLACLKPMLFFAGEKDGLFPVPSVKDAYAKMHEVRESRRAGGNLVTKTVPGPHVFNAEMQEEGFAWLDRHLKPKDPKTPPPAESGESSHLGKTKNIETTLVDSDAGFYGTFQSHNQTVVSAADGIFMTYSKKRVSEESGENERCLWRLVRSVDGGKRFDVVYESTGGTRAPALEVDRKGNLYMAHPDWTDPRRPFFFYRFARGGDYGKPVITTIEDVSCAAKYAMTYDPTRNVFYIAAQYGQVLTVDPEGRLLHRGRGFRQTGPHASTQYPHVAVTPDGVLHLAMTTVGQNREGKPVYWDIHYMNSPDGGRTWRKLDGTTLPEAPIPDETGPADRISLDDEFEINSWLGNMLVKDGRVHFIYHGKTMHYLRYDLTTGKKDASFDGKEFAGKDLALCNVSGLLTTRVDRTGSPLYCVSRDPARRTLACLVSRDNGTHWSDCAMANRTFDTNYATGGAHAVTDTGHIIGSFTDSANQSVWFYRIEAE